MQVQKRNGEFEALDFEKMERLNEYATRGLKVDKELLKRQIKVTIYDGMPTREILRAQIKGAADLISVENWQMTFVAARYLLAELTKQVNDSPYYPTLQKTIAKGVQAGRLNPKMLDFDMQILDDAINPDRDYHFDYIGLQNLADRYLLRNDDQEILELPQHFLMRVAMGLALNETDKNARAIEFYDQLSEVYFITSTPTLFNSGTNHSQLSSCYGNTVADQISSEIDEGQHRYESIFGTIEESARLSKFAGGIGTDWTRVRGSGSHIRSTNGRSSGIIPYIKVSNDTAIAVNQGGKRKGSFAPYLEVWHPDFWDYCELKKEFGDKRMRAEDVYPASWIPDLFMERKEADGMWSTFDPHKYPELHELWGDAFKQRYEQLEAEGKAISSRPAIEVWKHILTNLFETGHPWITFKDECNRRSPQQHDGVVHNSNLCTEITLNNSDTETFVCNLGSVNWVKHIVNGKIDIPRLQKTITTAIRMLDNVIDLNYYPSDRAKKSNMRHRPIGLGIMGEYEALIAMGIDPDSKKGLETISYMMESVSYFALIASAQLGQERGSYGSYEGSLWSQGIVPYDTAELKYEINYNWDEVRELVAIAMRNSNVMAIAPTATISIIAGVEPSFEAPFEITRSESNMSGDFQVVDPIVKYPNWKRLAKTVFERDPTWTIEAASRRQVWIDQSQSTNIFAPVGTKGRDLDTWYTLAWKRKLKTTYYLRTKSATKSAATKILESAINSAPVIAAEPVIHNLQMPDCESCQ